MLSGDNGILQRSTEAKEKSTVAGEKEQIQLEVLGSHENDGTLLVETVNSNIKNHISGVTTDDATEFPLTVTYIATGHNYIVNENGNVEEKINLAKNTLLVDTSKSDYSEISSYIRYYDKNNNPILCKVLYDSNSDYGLQIVTVDPVTTVTLGYGDPMIPENMSESGNQEKTKWSYNNAISTLNSQAEEYMNPSFSTMARCIGTNPSQPDLEGAYFNLYSNENLSFKNQYNSYEADWTQLGIIGTKEISNTSISSYYWLASRLITRRPITKRTSN